MAKRSIFSKKLASLEDRKVWSARLDDEEDAEAKARLIDILRQHPKMSFKDVLVRLLLHDADIDYGDAYGAFTQRDVRMLAEEVSPYMASILDDMLDDHIAKIAGNITVAPVQSGRRERDKDNSANRAMASMIGQMININQE